MTQNPEEEDLFFKILEAEISKKVEKSNNKKTTKNIFDNYSKFFAKRPKISLNCKAKDCELSAIQSHSISKNAVLNNISIKGKVYTPLVEKSTIKMGKVGVESQASVFPFLCNLHDTKYFSELDKLNLDFYSNVFFEQLISRTLSKEIYNRERNLSITEEVLSKLNLDFEQTKQSFIENFNKKGILSSAKVTDIKDSRFSYLKYKKELEEKLKSDQWKLAKTVNYYKSNPNIIKFFQIEKTLPVAFSGITNFYENNLEVHLIINCLPYKNETLLILAYNEKDEPIIEKELFSKYDLENNDSLLNFIEVISVNGTDNIFFDIKYWDNLPEETQKKYIKDFSNFTETDPRNELTYSFLEWDYR
ncbi:hypothetical protein KLA_16947 [Cellulophaga geojensis KL-A]|uniref:Uncharacterized protein n=2 Tax=Cellulophaga TaxID=104264 RepID=A0ABN0RJE1_9FLAO|nr:hypothetical protein KLA_16947 [Cellulophaga geojensis KL-A]